MPVIKIQNNLSGSNKGSSANSVSYLEKEQNFRDKSLRNNEEFFNEKGTNFKPEEVVKSLNSNRQGLKKTDAKYYSLTIAPSKKELAELSDNDLKNYAKDFMQLYAKQFNRNINSSDLVWFAKLEKTRKYKGFIHGKSEQLPQGKKSGEFKPGDNRHIHILVRRKTEKNIKLSPLANARGFEKGFAKNVKIGFDRVNFFEKAETLMIQKIVEKNKLYSLGSDDFFGSRYIKSKNYDFELAKKIGISPKMIENVRIKIALEVHSKDYPGKIPNISYSPEHLNKELQKKFGFQLTKEEAEKAYQIKKSLEKGKGMSM